MRELEEKAAGKFIDLWKQEGGTWKVARVIRYDHVLAPQPAASD